MIIKTDKDTIENYLTDASNLKGFSSKVIIPENSFELKQIISELYHQNQNYVISAAGTGLTGGKVPYNDIIVSLEKLNKILEIHPDKNFVRVQPGVTLSQLEENLNEFNLFLPPNPTEKNSSLGGNVANNSSGSRSFKYGPIRNFVKELCVVLVNGEILRLKRGEIFANGNNLRLTTEEKRIIEIEFDEIRQPDTKHAGGYFLRKNMDAIDLFIGSEGTLGIIEEITLSLEQRPEKILGLIIFFDREEAIFEFTDIIREKSRTNNKTNINENSDISARLIEFFDENSLIILRDKYPQVSENCKGAIWVEQEYTEDNENEILDKWFEIISTYTAFADSTWVATTEKEHNNFRDFRHQLPLMVNDKIVRNKFRKVGTDTAVPNRNFREYFYYIKELLIASEIDYVIFGHIGDSHLHANLFPRDESELQKALDFYESIIKKSIDLGGTISAEHGIGKLKKEYFSQMIGYNGIKSMKKIKNIFDPKNLLGRGNLFD